MDGNIKNELYSGEFEIFTGALKYTSPLLYAATAEVYKKRADFKKALLFYDKAFALSPFNTSLTFNKGVCELLTENFGLALKSFRSVLEITPDNLDAQMNLALAHELSDENETALKIYTKIFEQHPSFSVAAIRAALISVKLKNYDNALKFLLQVKNADFSAKLNKTLGLCFEKTGDFSRARRFYGKALRQNGQIDEDYEMKQKFRSLLKKSVKKSLLSVSTAG